MQVEQAVLTGVIKGLQTSVKLGYDPLKSHGITLSQRRTRQTQGAWAQVLPHRSVYHLGMRSWELEALRNQMSKDLYLSGAPG